MDNFELYKELYHKENDRRNEVQDALNIPIAIVSALITAIYFLLTNFDYEVSVIVNYIFYLFSIVTVGCILSSIFYLVKAFSNLTKGYEYSGLSYPKELYNWNIELENYYKTYFDNVSLAEQEFKKHIIEKLVTHTDHNMYVNDEKYGYIYNSKKYLIFCLISILTTLFPFGYNYVLKKDNIQKVQIINIEREKSNNQLKHNKTKQANGSKSTKSVPTTTSSAPTS